VVRKKRVTKTDKKVESEGRNPRKKKGKGPSVRQSFPGNGDQSMRIKGNPKSRMERFKKREESKRKQGSRITM